MAARAGALSSCAQMLLVHDARGMGLREWVGAAAFVVVATACGGRLLSLSSGESSDAGPADASVDGEDGATPDGAPADERGPVPVPVCSGQLSMCRPPDAGVVWTGASVVQCQPEEYVGPWTLVLERLSGSTWQAVQTKVVEEPGFGATFYDSSGPPTLLTYRVCALAANMTALCGGSFTTQGPPNCACEPTTCYLNTACNTEIDNQCGSYDVCGACTNGMLCNAYHTCCPGGFMSNGWGGCVCAPGVFYVNGVPKSCPIWAWDTVTCTCNAGM